MDLDKEVLQEVKQRIIDEEGTIASEKPNDRVVQVANQLIANLQDEEAKSLVQSSEITDPMLGLKQTLAGSITSRLSQIKDEEEFENLLKVAMVEKVKQGGVQFTDLANSLNQTRIRKTESMESLLNFFKPTIGEQSPLLADPKETGDIGEFTANLDSKAMQAINNLTTILEAMPVKEEEE